LAPAHGNVSFWDFGRFPPYAAKVIPPADDRMTNANWQWEIGHLNRELGDLILRQALGGASGLLARGGYGLDT